MKNLESLQMNRRKKTSCRLCSGLLRTSILLFGHQNIKANNMNILPRQSVATIENTQGCLGTNVRSKLQYVQFARVTELISAVYSIDPE